MLTLCAFFVISVPLWWLLLLTEFTTETRRTQRWHRGKPKQEHRSASGSVIF
jgi:hypothetical protein